MSLMQRFADPELIHQMSMGEKMLGSLMVTILGMGITFVVLVLLWALISIMTKVLNKASQPKAVAPTATPATAPTAIQTKDQDAAEDDASLIAVITAAIAASIQRPVQTILVKNIRRSSDIMPAWASAAKQEQIDSRRI